MFASNLEDIEGIINHDIRMLVTLANQWLVKFNPLRTEAILFTLKLFENYPNLIFDGTQIQFVDDHKHLGLTISKNGKWHSHIENILNSAAKVIGILNSAAKVIGILRKLKFTLNRIAPNRIYMSFVLPILEYSSIVWDNCTEQNVNALEKLQNDAARIVTELTRSVSIENLYKECG